ncbi:MAG: YqjF family protein [Gemmatimonadota bacterium]
MTRAIMERTAHRPWPPPDRRWSHLQRWRDLLFAHWPLRPGALGPLVPEPLVLDTFDGSAWLGVVPFVLGRLRPRGLPPVPGASRFPELNVRTYVTLDGKPGVYFFSLDAASALAVLGARLVFRLPYFRAAMRVRREGREEAGDDDAATVVVYRSRRARGWLGAGGGPRRDAAPPARGERPELEVRYRPTAPPSTAEPGTLEHFLTERYCLYTVDRRGRAYRVEIHHPPWPLQRAEAEFRVDTMARAAGIERPDASPLLHYSRHQDVVGWMPERVR